jgi:hypothetical protein
MKHRLIPLVAAVTLALAGCAVYTANPYPPVPPPQAEVMPKPPVSAQPLIWQPGHWDWNGANYVWTPGAWVPRAGHGSLWQYGYWTLSGGTWVWVPSHWT